MKGLQYVFALLLTFNACQSQTIKQDNNKLVGGPCEGCEAIYEYGNKVLTVTDTLPAFYENEPKINLSGTVFEKDGKTPAQNVILYIYHTNRKGIYEKRGNEKGWGKRHGFIRGWIKTDSDGNYSFYTFRPASYPDRNEPEHIHVTVKETNINEYYIDNFVFDDDPMLTESKREKLKNRGGSGIAKPKMENDILTIHRDIILGLNIPDY